MSATPVPAVLSASAMLILAGWASADVSALSASLASQGAWIALRIRLDAGPVHLQMVGHQDCPGERYCFIGLAQWGSNGAQRVSTVTSLAFGLEGTARSDASGQPLVISSWTPLQATLFPEQPDPLPTRITSNRTYMSSAWGDSVLIFMLSSPGKMNISLSYAASDRVSILVGSTSQAAFMRDFSSTVHVHVAEAVAGAGYEKTVSVSKGMLGLFLPAGGGLGFTGDTAYGHAGTRHPCEAAQSYTLPGGYRAVLYCLDLVPLAGPPGPWHFEVQYRARLGFADVPMVVWADTAVP